MDDETRGHTNLGYITTEGKENGTTLDKLGEAAPDNISTAEGATGKERPTWTNSLDLLMSCISLSVGLGNIWRFPFTAFENGGGAFLIPYIIVLFLVGKPMYYMEMIIGQFTSRNNVRMWAVSPAMKGVGVGQLIANASVVSYYVSLMAITLFYLSMSFSARLPWSYCWPEWGECFDASDKTNITHGANTTSSSELYFTKEVLKEIPDIENGIGVPDWRLTLCLLASWFAIFMVMIKGVKSSGKVAYFLAIFPYIVMFALLIRAVTLPGAVDGIIFFIKPQWGELLNPRVWYAATTQVFFSLSVCVGAIIMFSSYNQFEHKIHRDAMIVTTLDTFTSLLAGFTIFGILGNLAHEKGTKDIKSVIGTGGSGLAFISYPDAISKFDWAPQVFAVLFFLMLFVLGLGSAVSLQSAIVTALTDRFKTRKYWQMALVACCSGFLVGLVYVTPGGQYVLTLVDAFPGTFLILGMAIAEIVGIFWIYGLENFCVDMEFMTGMVVTKYWRWCWGIITPFIMIVVFLYAFISLQRTKYGDYVLPMKAYATGWTCLAIGLLQLPIWALVRFYINREGTWGEMIKNSFKASVKWGPKDPKIKQEWLAYKEQAKKERKSLNLPHWKHILYSLNGTYGAITRRRMKRENGQM